MDADMEVEVYSPEEAKMAAAIQRLRKERDGLRVENETLHRDNEFMKAENWFKTQSLEKEIQELRSALSSTSPTSSPVHTTSDAHVIHLQRTALVAAIVAQRTDAERELYAAKLDALSHTLAETQAQAQEAERMAKEKDAALRKVRNEDAEMRDCLATTEFKLSTSDARIADLSSLVSRLKEEIEGSAESQREVSDSLARYEAQLADVTRQLQESEAQRGSMALQITHLEQDLHTAKEELTEAESRYSTLQAQQLSSMSSNEQSRALRRQIEELEHRVTRRTEQIGIHQHDIKRLETNLRLQEDRVMEMTSELEVAEAEKLAMVDDCRTTREERDEAMKRCEELEETVEVLETNLADVKRQRNLEVAAVVEVAMAAYTQRRQLSSSFTRSIARKEAHLATLESRAQDAQQSAEAALAAVEHHATSHQTALQNLHDSQAQVQLSLVERAEAHQQATQATVALATVFKVSRSSFHTARELQHSLQVELAEVKKQFETHLGEFAALQARHDALLHQEDEKSTSIQILEQRCGGLEYSLETLQENHADSLAELTRVQEELRAHMADSVGRLEEEGALRAELEAVQERFKTEADNLRMELAKATEDLDEAKLQRANLESTHRQVLDDLNATKDELQSSLEEALKQLEQGKDSSDQLELQQQQQSAEVDALQEELENVKRSLDEVTRIRDDLSAGQASLAQELESREKEVSEALQAKEDLESEIQTVRLEHVSETNSLALRLEDAEAQKSSNADALLELQTRYDEVLQKKNELEDSLSETALALESLKVEFKAEADRYQRLSEEHAAELKAAMAKQQEAGASRSEIEQELDAARQQLRVAEEGLAKVQREHEHEQTVNTSLQADIQKHLSQQRTHEVHIKECEREIIELQQKLSAARADHSRSEQNAKSAEMQLTLQAIKHKEAVESLRAQLAGLKETAKLEETVFELQEKTEYLEKILQEKNVEIEENDDRFIQHSKEKKKLNSKVESLTRKLKALQEKLAGSQDSTPKALPQAPKPAPLQSGPPLLTPAAPVERVLSPVIPENIPSTSRVRSHTGPAAATSSRSREDSMPTYRPRTPEARPPPPQGPLPPLPHMSDDMMPEFSHSESSSSIGKKRRVPDDFDDNVPVQYFSADSVPVGGQGGSKTPRARRPLTGFTPVRGLSSRPNPALAKSPSRHATAGAPLPPAAIIADVTNSPRSKSSALKKGWLKMKPGSGQSSSRASSSRPTMGDKLQNR